MAKECVECGTVSRSDTGYCDACGGSDWQDAPLSRVARWRLLSSTAALAVLGTVIWWLVTHQP